MMDKFGNTTLGIALLAILLNTNGIVDLKLSVIFASLKCMLHSRAQRVATMLLCDVC